MNYRLKKGQENIVIMGGPFEGKKFVRGVEYSEIPPEEKHRFEKVGTDFKPVSKTKPATKSIAGGGEL